MPIGPDTINMFKCWEKRGWEATGSPIVQADTKVSQCLYIDKGSAEVLGGDGERVEKEEEEGGGALKLEKRLGSN